MCPARAPIPVSQTKTKKTSPCRDERSNYPRTKNNTYHSCFGHGKGSSRKKASLLHGLEVAVGIVLVMIKMETPSHSKRASRTNAASLSNNKKKQEPPLPSRPPDPQGKRSGRNGGAWIGFGAAPPSPRRTKSSILSHHSMSSIKAPPTRAISSRVPQKKNQLPLQPRRTPNDPPPSSSSPQKKKHQQSQKQKQKQQQDELPSSSSSALLLKDAEKLVQLMLGNESEQLTKESLEKAMKQYDQAQSITQTKKRYSTLMEKPWRTTSSSSASSDHASSSRDEDERRISEMKSRNPQSFRRDSASSPNLFAAATTKRMHSFDRVQDLLGGKMDTVGDDDDDDDEDDIINNSNNNSNGNAAAAAAELAQMQNRLNLANTQIAMFKSQIASLQQQQRQRSSNDSSMMLSFAEDSGIGLDFCNNNTNSSHNKDGSGNEPNSGTENQQQQQQTIQMLQAKIQSLEANLEEEIEGRKDEEADLLHENKILLTKIESLEQSIEIEEKFKEQKRLQAHENQLKIEELEKQLSEYEDKLTQHESRQCEQVQSLLDQIAKAERDLTDSGNRHREELQEALAKQSVEMEQKWRGEETARANKLQLQITGLEQQLMQAKQEAAMQETRQADEVQALLEKLASADAKLQEQEKTLRTEILESTSHERKNLEETFREKARYESSKLKASISVLEKQVADSKRKLTEQEERHCVEMQALLEQQASHQAAIDTQRETELRSSQLQQELTAANEKVHEATQRLADLEQAQAREQEILSRELRESESTIAGLMDEVSALRPLPLELERTQRDLDEARSDLDEANRKVEELVVNTHEMLESLQQSRQNETSLREELDLLAPLAMDLELAEEALEATRENLAAMEQRVNELKRKKGGTESAKKLKVQVAELQEELSATFEESEKVRKRAAAVEREHKAELELHVEQLKEAKARIASLEVEVEGMRLKLAGAEKSEDVKKEADEKIEGLNTLLAQKEKEIESLQADVNDQQKQITSSRLQIEEMDEERHYNRAKMQELSSMLKSSSDASENEERLQKRLEARTEMCAKLTGERDSIKQKLSVLETMITVLETDNQQKKKLVQELMASKDDSSSSQAIIESLQKEQERTLKRCTDLSLQLAESQFRIDELTGKLRRVERSTSNHVPNVGKQRRQPSLASMQAVLAGGVTSAVDTLQDSSRRGFFSRGVSGYSKSDS